MIDALLVDTEVTELGRFLIMEPIAVVYNRSIRINTDFYASSSLEIADSD